MHRYINKCKESRNLEKRALTREIREEILTYSTISYLSQSQSRSCCSVVQDLDVVVSWCRSSGPMNLAAATVVLLLLLVELCVRAESSWLKIGWLIN